MVTITTADIHDWIKQLKGAPLNVDEGMSFGQARAPVTGATVCWAASPENFRAAAQNGHELVIHHEALLFPYPFDGKWPRDVLTWPTNTQRVSALTQNDLCATRLHGSIDQLWIFKA